MKYKPTPINLICGLLIIVSIYGAISPGPMGFGFFGLFYLLPIALFGLGLDYLGQRTIKKYSNLFLIEGGVIALISFAFALPERTKTFIIPDQRNFEFIVTIYSVEGTEELPVNFFSWAYEKEIPENGILLTSSQLKRDLPKTKVYTKSGLSLQDRNDTIDFCFGHVSTSKIQVDTMIYDYQAWKIDKGGTIGYSTNDIKKLEEELIKFLKTKKPHG